MLLIFILGFIDGESLVDARKSARSEQRPLALIPNSYELGLIPMAVDYTAFATILSCEIQPYENPSDRSWPMS